MGTGSPKIGYGPMNAVVTFRAEPHIRLDNKLWTVHGIWIFIKEPKESPFNLNCFPLVSKKVIYIYIHTPSRPFIYAFVSRISGCTSAATSREFGKSNHTLFLPCSGTLWPPAPALE